MKVSDILKDELHRDDFMKFLSHHFISLLKDLPSDTVLMRTANNETITVRDILQGSELGLSFIHDVLRISRDRLKRDANKS